MTSTTATTPTVVREFNSPVENTLVLARENGEQAQFAIQHFGSHQAVSLTVIAAPVEDGEIKESATFSPAEALALRDFLTRADISALLEHMAAEQQ